MSRVNVHGGRSAGWQFAGFNFAVPGAVFYGPPLVFEVDLLLRPLSARSVAASAIVAVALTAVSFSPFLVLYFLALEPIGIALSVLAGALVSAQTARPSAGAATSYPRTESRPNQEAHP